MAPFLCAGAEGLGRAIKPVADQSRVAADCGRTAIGRTAPLRVTELAIYGGQALVVGDDAIANPTLMKRPVICDSTTLLTISARPMLKEWTKACVLTSSTS